MSSFFKIFLDKINHRDENSDDIRKGGRYLAIILEEIVRLDPAFANILFPEMKNFIPKKMPVDSDFAVSTEYSFPVGEKNRRADLMVNYGERRALLEIKWNDTLIENEEGSQLEDYIAYCNGENDCEAFSILYLNDKFTAEQRKAIGKGLSRGRAIDKISCADLYYAIEERLNKGACTAVAAGVQGMLLEYLGENVMKYTGKVSVNALKMIVSAGLCLSEKNNGQFNSNDTTAQVPNAWKTLLDNFSDINSRICAEIKESDEGIVGKLPITYFHFNPCFSMQSLKKMLKSNGEDEEDIYLSRSGGSSGIVATKGYFSIYSMISHAKDVRLYYGAYFWVDKTGKKFDIEYYAYCGGKGYEEVEMKLPLKVEKEDMKDVYILPSRDEMYGAQVKVISEFLENVLETEKSGKSLSGDLAGWYKRFRDIIRTLYLKTNVD